MHKVKETKSTVRYNTAEDDVAATAIRRMRLLETQEQREFTQSSACPEKSTKVVSRANRESNNVDDRIHHLTTCTINEALYVLPLV